MSRYGKVFNVQRFTIHDGPGLRTEFFLKGCPLQCKWCSNPESLKSTPQLGVYKSKCISMKKCGACAEACPQKNTLQFYRGRLTKIDYSLCTNCNACYDACPSDAIKKWGEKLSVEQCMEIIRRDKGYFETSGGGVTVSGGDPILQSDFVAELFEECKKEGIHTCFESSFCGKWDMIENVMPYTDLFIVDIKHMDSQIHEENTGVSNKRILENLAYLSSQDTDIILRIPVIPDFNDDLENMKATANFILEKMNGKVRTLQLLSFMRLGEEKYQALGMEYLYGDIRLNRKGFQKEIKKYAEYFNMRGIHCMVGTKEQY